MNVDAALLVAIRTSSAKQASTLLSNLGATLTATISGVRTRQLPAKWASGTQPRHEARRRLSLGYACWLALESEEGADTARNWFIGANPWLRDRAPTMVIRETTDNIEVLAALRAFLEDAGGA